MNIRPILAIAFSLAGAFSLTGACAPAWADPPANADAAAEAVVAAFGPAMEALGRKDYPAAEKGLRTVLALIEKSEGPNSPEAGQVLAALAAAVENQGRYAEAEPLYRRAFDNLPAGAPELPIVIGNLANNLNSQGRHAEAEPLYRKLIDFRREVGGTTSPEYGQTLNSLGFTLVELGRAREAEPMLRQALAIARATAGDTSEPVARAETDLGGAVEALGRYGEAEAHFRNALAIRRTVAGDKSADTALAYNNVGSVLDRQGRIDDAEPFFQRALEIFRAARGEQDRQVAVAYSNLGLIRLERLDNRGAEENFRKALAISRATLGAEHPDTASREALLAAALRDQQRYAEAEPLMRHALAVRRKTLGDAHPLTGRAYSAYASLLLAKGDAAGAIAAYRTALDIQRKALGSRHPDVAAAYSNLADAERLQPATLPAALEDARKGMTLARQLRDRRDKGKDGRGADRARRTVAGAIARNALREDAAQPAYAIFLDAAWANAAARPGDAEALRSEAFEAAQDLERSAAAEAVAQAAARSLARTGDLAVLARRQQDLIAEARAIDARLLQGLAQDNAEAPAQLDRLDKIGEELAATEAALRRGFPAYADLVSPRAIALADVRGRLGPGEALLMIAPSGYDTYAFALSASGSNWIKVENNAARLVGAVGRLRCEVDQFTCLPADRDDRAATPEQAKGHRRFDRQAAYELYRDLIAPLEPSFAGAKRLYVSISGPLSDLPLGMLITAPPAAGDDADPKLLLATPWLTDRYAITTLPAVSVLRALQPAVARRGSQPFIGFGDPALLGQAGAAVAALRAGTPVFRDVDDDGTPLANPDFLRSLEPLPGTKTELSAMAKALNAPPGALHLDKAATETEVRTDPALGTARVIAFATHGALPREANGFEQPGLVLTPPQVASARDDGFLAASEAAGLKLSADWVILSACNTASSEGNGGADSLSALASAFLYAGADALLASHWRVEDDVTAALTVETLKSWSGDPHLTRAEALQRALRAVRTGERADGSKLAGWNENWAHPGSWAPFSLIAGRDAAR
jgi:CHAT domain-containing protein/Flp pilus assembly protein TadD